MAYRSRRLIVLQPWDKSAIPAIEKAIQTSNLGLTPSQRRDRHPSADTPSYGGAPHGTRARGSADGGGQQGLCEECRRDANEMLKDGQKEGEIPEDESRKGQDQVQKLTDDFVEEIDKLLARKEEEIMEV